MARAGGVAERRASAASGPEKRSRAKARDNKYAARRLQALVRPPVDHVKGQGGAIERL